MNILTPNAHVDKKMSWYLIAGWAIFAALFWSFFPFRLIPNLPEVGAALGTQWEQGVVYELLASLQISLEAISISVVIGLGLAYLSTIPLFRAPVELIGKMRFLSLTGIILIFILMTPSGHWLKVSVLCFAIVTFFVNDMRQIIDDIPQSRFDHARTLGLSQFAVLREVVVRGTLGNAFESLRMNAAMSWMMLTMVEGLSRSEGGIGVLLLNLNRHMRLDAIFGIQLLIFIVGIGQDALIKWIKASVCPYTVVKK